MTVWANVMVGFAVGIFLAILILGAYTFRPHRARNVKYAESYQDSVVEHVVLAKLAHPEIVKINRMDRHRFYVIPHMAVLCYAICVFSGAPLTSNVAALGTVTRYTMATCFLVGSTLVLVGVSLGLNVGRWVIAPKTRSHVTAEVLGDDIVLPYRLSMAGMSAMTVSLSMYAWTSFQSTAGSLGGWISGALVVACLFAISDFYRASATFDRWDTILITEALAAANRSEP